ncbi:ABC transporter permease [Spirillospora sp. NPDC029432]|uniref:ABC transporter permease n=1 Tax=Spirillospora sp. NPDC029432 TaxID=3154599 RepID=UPI00345485D7
MTAPAPAVLTEPARPSAARLTAVELRKMTDTRSGRWLLIVIALSTVALMPVIVFTVPERDQTLLEMLVATQAGVSLLLPVVGILAVTSEWSQRTALTTFALVPGRFRVLGAKAAATGLLATAFLVIGLAVAAATRALGGAFGRSAGDWSIPPAQLGGLLVFSLAMVFMGVAFGLLLQSPALSIVLFFVIPTLWSTLNELVKKLQKPAEWLDANRTLAVLSDPAGGVATAGEWARIGVSLAVWLLLPLVIGLVRLSRREVK